MRFYNWQEEVAAIKNPSALSEKHAYMLVVSVSVDPDHQAMPCPLQLRGIG